MLTNKNVNIKKHLPFMLVLFMGGLFFYTYHSNPEIMNYDAYNHLRRYSHYGMWNLFPDEHSLKGLRDWIVSNLGILYSDEHGISPGIFIGPFYRICDFLGIPITLKVLYLPIVFFSCIIVLLFYLLLIRLEFGIIPALCGSSLLMMSPSLTYLARSGVAGHLAVVLLNQLLCLNALVFFSGTRRSKVFVSLAVFHLVISEISWFASGFLLFFAYLVRTPLLWKDRSLSALWSGFRKNARPLIDKIIWLPSALILLLHVTVTILMVYMPERFPRGFQGTLLTKALGKAYTSVGSSLLFSAPSDLYYYWVWLFGELFPFIFVPAVFLTIKFFNRYSKYNWVSFYAVIASLAFSIICYRKSYSDVLIWYQMYLLVPYLLIIMWGARTAAQAWPRMKVAVVSAMILLLISTSLATATFVWKKPLTFLDWRENFIKIKLRNFGAQATSEGAKTAGFLVREILHSELPSADSLVVHYVYLYPDARPYGVYAGFFRDLKRYKEDYPDVNIEMYGYRYDQQVGFKLEGKERLEDLPQEIFSQIRMPEYFCILDFKGHGTNNWYKYSVVDSSGKRFFSFYINKLSNETSRRFPPGEYLVGSMDKLFDKKYYRLKNFFGAF
ncbi:MAG TPA: hypothetical protein VM123_17080 [archaeon]|nr:hypothetical protein [archaeon]